MEGGLGAGLEIGIVIFAPQFLTRDFIKNNHIQYQELPQSDEFKLKAVILSYYFSVIAMNHT
jgi:hypothetical protein